MQTQRFPERHPVLFSVLILLVFLFIQGAGVAVAQQRGLPASSFAVYTQILLVILLLVLVSLLGWWREIGFRAGSGAALLLYLPALALVVGNLTFGVYVTAPPALLLYALLGLASGFVEEVLFRGLILRAFLPRGGWAAVLISTALFGLLHVANLLAGSASLYVFVQIAYALAIGFGFGAMRLRGGLLWSLVIAHGLGNFIAFINTPQGGPGGSEVPPQAWIVSILYILIFTGYGLYLMRREANVSKTPLPA